MNGRQRSETKEKFWREHVAAYQRSKLSVRRYCEQAGLKEPSFYGWRRELARRDAVRPVAKHDADRVRKAQSVKPTRQRRTAPGNWIQLKLAQPSSVTGIEIVLQQGTLVRLSGPVNRQALAEVLDVLEGRRC